MNEELFAEAIGHLHEARALFRQANNDHDNGWTQDMDAEIQHAEAVLARLRAGKGSPS